MKCHRGVADELTVEPIVGIDDVFNSLYSAQFDHLVRLASLLVGSTAAAEDIVQDSFAK